MKEDCDTISLKTEPISITIQYTVHMRRFKSGILSSCQRFLYVGTKRVGGLNQPTFFKLVKTAEKVNFLIFFQGKI